MNRSASKFQRRWHQGARALILSAAAAAACSPEGRQPRDPGADGTGGTGNGNGGNGVGGIDNEGDGLQACAESLPGPPLLRRLNTREFQATLEDVFPQVAGAWTNALSSDPISHYGYDNAADRLVVGRQKAREIDDTAASLASAITSSLSNILPCASAADRACAETYLDTYGKRLFRRPLNDQERATFLGFFDEAAQKTNFGEAIGWLTRALVHAPQTVYRSEIGALAGGNRQLSPYETAAALSYAFGGTTPSDDLLARAEAGELNSPEALVSVARELMATARGRDNLHHLFGAWLEYPRVTTVTKANVPAFEQLRPQMREETRRFIELVVFEQGGGLQDLLTSPQTTPSRGAAEFFGYPVPSTDYAPVERPETAGIGILAQSSILATQASPNGSSPTKRGLLVMENMLCRTPPEVPPDVPSLPEPTVGQVTTRQRYEELHAPGPCWTCHQHFDPIGFGFEHFDEVGKYRADEGGLTIDASGQVPGPGVTFPFEGQADMALQLAEAEEVQLCISARVKAYAFGNEAACLGESEREAFMSGAMGFIDYIASLAAEPSFVRRSN